MAQAENTVNFEDALKQLDERVRKLESGDLPLDDSIRVFEEGMQFAKKCETQLAEAKGKVEILLKQADGSVAAEAFTTE